MGEWCQDTWDPYPDEPRVDPLAQEGGYRIFHEGGWNYPSGRIRGASRGSMAGLVLNEDDSHFYSSRGPEDLTAGDCEGILILNATVPVGRLTAVDPGRPRRPRAGTVTSAPVRYRDDAFEPLSEDELKVWGL